MDVPELSVAAIEASGHARVSVVRGLVLLLSLTTPAACAEPSAPPARPAAQQAPQPVARDAEKLTDAEREEFTSRCVVFFDAAPKGAVVQGTELPDYAAIRASTIHAAFGATPTGREADAARCRALFERSFDRTMEDAFEVEVRTVFDVIEKGLSRTYRGKGIGANGAALPPGICPSEPPIPPNLALVRNKHHASTVAEWHTPGWSCVLLNMSFTVIHYQYELETDARTRAFTVTARGFTPSLRHLVVLKESGVVEANAVTVTRKSRDEYDAP